MAINARLLGMAQGGGRPLDLAGAVQPAIDTMDQKVLEYKKQRALEGQAYAKAMKEREAFASKLISQYQNPDFKGVPPQGMRYLTEKAAAIKMNVYNIAMSDEISDIQKTMLVNEEKEKIAELKYWADQYKASGEDFLEQSDMLSNLNDAKSIKLNKMRMAGEFELFENQAIFNINMSGVEGEEEQIAIDIKDLLNAFGLIEQDHKVYLDLLKSINESAKKLALKGDSSKGLDFEVQKGIEALKLTDTQYATLAVDHLGYLKGDEAGILLQKLASEEGDELSSLEFKQYLIGDLQDGSIVDEEDGDGDILILETLKEFVHENIRKSAKEHYEGFYQRKVTPPTQTDSDRAQVKEDAIELMQNFHSSLQSALANTEKEYKNEAGEIVNAAGEIIKEEDRIDRQEEAMNNVIEAIRKQPIFSTSKFQTTSLKKSLITKAFMKDLNMNQKQAEEAYRKRFPSDPLFFIDDYPIYDVDALLNVYNLKQRSTMRLDNSEMQSILNNIVKDEDGEVNEDYSI